jgi:hypothetical protein
MTESIQIALRISQAALERADRLIAGLSEEHGIEASRAGVLRRAILIGLRAMENEAKRP